jgi:hypothetical protein
MLKDPQHQQDFQYMGFQTTGIVLFCNGVIVKYANLEYYKLSD